ncbi:MAG: response regulator, partial [Nitrososphaeraceae archaeon]
ITTGHLDVFKIITFNVISSSSHYDELITNKHLQAREEYEHSIQKRHLKIQEETFHNQKKRKILVVDDEPDICLIYRIVLQDAGFECKSYTDSVKAMQEFKPNYYDLILLDIKMPILNGFELCKKIREADKTVQIAFVTASEVYYEKAREKYYPELANINYIQKPIGNEELVCIVNIMIAASDAN